MKIVFVLECAGMMTNGTTASCVRFAKGLEAKGHEVTIIGGKIENVRPEVTNYIELDSYHFPFFNWLIIKEGFRFVKCQPEKMIDAIKNADVVHFFLPFKLANTARLIAEAYHVPVTGAFHMQPESISCAIHLGWFEPLNAALYAAFRTYIYKEISYVHCPSNMIKGELKRHNYVNHYRVISNGINNDFWHKVECKKDPRFEGKFVVSMVGRLAKEKRQDLLLKAVKKSKYEKDIQVVLCGQGPNAPFYKLLAKRLRLTNEPIFEFMNQEQLREFLSNLDLYVHCSDSEVEGLSALEAMCCGVVPVIAESRTSATKDFALHKKSIFKHGNAKQLARRIDYWIEHPQEKAHLSKEYEKLRDEYALDLQIDKFEQFFESAIANYKKGKDASMQKTKRSDLRMMKKLFKRALKKGAITELPEILQKKNKK